jgi:hypothetical protein
MLPFKCMCGMPMVDPLPQRSTGTLCPCHTSMDTVRVGTRLARLRLVIHLPPARNQGRRSVPLLFLFALALYEGMDSGSSSNQERGSRA